MADKVKISGFLAYYEPRAVVTDGYTTDPPPENQIGYVMGGDGRIADDAYILKRAKSSYPKNWEPYYLAYKKWIGHEVIDCNAMMEAYYKRITGKNIDTKARYNYASWCSVRDVADLDNALADMPQLPGVALFSGPTNSAAGITHVGILLRKYGPGPLDWYVLECRGKDYGLVITTLKSRKWEWWGVMDKYFVYDLTAEGEAAEAPQVYHGKATGNCRIRKAPNILSAKVVTAPRGTLLLVFAAVDGWCQVAAAVDGKLISGYMSAKYIKGV